MYKQRTDKNNILYCIANIENKISLNIFWPGLSKK